VGVAECLSQLAEEVEPQLRAHPSAPLAQEQVKAHRFRVVLEDQRRAAFALLEVEDLEDARVVDALEDAERARRHPAQTRPRVGRGGRRVGVDPHAALHAEADMTGFEVLPAVALGEELAELVVADAALA
jgi:hypothetical protein